MSKNIWLWLVLILVIGIGFYFSFLPSSVNNTKAEIVLWHYFGNSKGLEWVKNEFNNNHDNIKLKTKYIHFSELENQLSKAAMSGEVPNLVILSGESHAKWSDLGALADISNKIKKWGNEDKYYQEALLTTIYQGRNYGIPYNINTLCIFYNKDLFKKNGLNPKTPPKTWAEIKEYSKAISKPQEKIYGFGFSAPKNEAATFQFLPFLWQAGGKIKELNSKESKEAFQFWKESIEKEYVSKSALNTSQYELVLNFVSGNIGMVVNGPWALTALKDAEFEYGVTLMPQKYSVNKSISILGGENIAILADSRHQEEAWEFMKFSQQKRVLSKWCELDNRIPARKDIIENSPKWNEAELKVFVEQIKKSKARKSYTNWEKISHQIQTAIQKILTEGNMNTVLDQTDKNINKLLNQ